MPPKYGLMLRTTHFKHKLTHEIRHTKACKDSLLVNVLIDCAEGYTLDDVGARCIEFEEVTPMPVPKSPQEPVQEPLQEPVQEPAPKVVFQVNC